jgi:hypothetical protein
MYYFSGLQSRGMERRNIRITGTENVFELYILSCSGEIQGLREALIPTIVCSNFQIFGDIKDDAL